MLANHFVIQQVASNSQVTVYQARSDYLPWQFETRRGPISGDNLDVFPFQFEENVPINRSRGREQRRLPWLGKNNLQYLATSTRCQGDLSSGFCFPKDLSPM